jgi:RNA polymerase sigma-70 factor (ECF subfamily)
MTEKEFADIVGSTKKIVLSAIERHLSARFYHSIDDIAQETYLRAYKSLTKDKFRGDSRIGTWLYTIAKNETLRMNRRLAREEEKFKKSVLNIENSAEEQGREPDEFESLYHTIDELPEIYREVMVLVSRGLSVKQISDKLGIEAGTVKSRTSRGKVLLQKFLTENNYGK